MNKLAVEISNDLNLKYKELAVINNSRKNIIDEIDFLKNKLYKTCQHQWIIDHNNCGERTELICQHCQMYKMA